MYIILYDSYAVLRIVIIRYTHDDINKTRFNRYVGVKKNVQTRNRELNDKTKRTNGELQKL